MEFELCVRKDSSTDRVRHEGRPRSRKGGTDRHSNAGHVFHRSFALHPALPATGEVALSALVEEVCLEFIAVTLGSSSCRRLDIPIRTDPNTGP